MADLKLVYKFVLYVTINLVFTPKIKPDLCPDIQCPALPDVRPDLRRKQVPVSSASQFKIAGFDGMWRALPFPKMVLKKTEKREHSKEDLTGQKGKFSLSLRRFRFGERDKE
jgi:hypothetical protein